MWVQNIIQKLFNRNQVHAASAGIRALPGVNLGGWLVLEKWITPTLFAGLSAADEYSLSRHASPAIRGMLRLHRDKFITKADFEWLAAHGIRAVRLPVGSWAFGDEPPYEGSIEYVDKAFAWAEQTGLKVLLDLHGVPGSQNGWDHSGHAGDVSWHTDETNVIKSLQTVARLAERYAGNPQLLGIELLNEPRPVIPWRILRKYYDAAYRIVRDRCGPDIWVVVHDNFQLKRWRRRMIGSRYHNLYLDTHQYRCFSAIDKQTSVYRHIGHMLNQTSRLLSGASRAHPVIIGEWSLALNPGSLRGVKPDLMNEAVKEYGAAQLRTYNGVRAWFYWTYKTEGGGAWSFRDIVQRGLFEPEN